MNDETTSAVVPVGGGYDAAQLEATDRAVGGGVTATGKRWWDDAIRRVQATPDVLAEAVERVLDRTVASAVRDPLDIHDPEAAYERVRESWSTPNPAGLIAGWIASKWATRTLRVGKRFSLPVRALITAVPPLGLSFKRGTVELRVLASFVVNRLREQSVVVDERFVQRVTVNAYCWPNLGTDVVRERTSAIVRLATLWGARALTSDEPGVRVRDAASALAKLDFRSLYDHLER